MDDNRKNSSSGIIILFLMFVFFSFIQGEKERQITGTATHSPVISDAAGSGLQAIINPAISTPGTDIYRINTLHAKCACLDCTSGREFVFNNLVSSSFSSCQLKFHFRSPIIGLFFLQKVPEQGKEDDILPIT
jgi:hypothetical protein